MLITPTIDVGSNDTVYRWAGMMGSTDLAECDIGEAIEISPFLDRSVQLVGSWPQGNKLLLEFNSDPVNMPWFGITPLAAMLLITPGKAYGASAAAVWPHSRFFRPRISNTYNPTGAPIDVVLFCLNKGI